MCSVDLVCWQVDLEEIVARDESWKVKWLRLATKGERRRWLSNASNFTTCPARSLLNECSRSCPLPGRIPFSEHSSCHAKLGRGSSSLWT
jgi:hypothetical protein